MGERSENTVSGTVEGSLVQAGVVHGGVHVHQPSSRTSIPRQMLPVSASFTNRLDELTDLDRLLSPAREAGPGLVVLTGQGGIGKTALAARWISEHAARFPDGQLYVDLGAFGDGAPAAPDEVLTKFLRALEVPAGQIPLDLTEQAALYRSVTAGKAIAVLADNADSAAQVRPLLPTSPASVVIVTSRWRLGGLALDGARVLVVRPLGQEAAFDLLKRTVGNERVDTEHRSAERLVDLCAGLPIALGVAAARLSMRPHWPISRLVNVLSDERRRLSALTVAKETVVHASFELSYQELPASTARAYRLLSLHPGQEFGSALAAAAIDVSSIDADEVLDDLVNVNLLTDTGPDRYRFHDLVRVHARHRAESDDTDTARSDAIRRMVDWYLDNVASADLVAMPLRPRIGERFERLRDRQPAFPEAVAALDWVEQELENVVDATRTADHHEWWEESWQLCEALWSLFLYRKHYKQWMLTHEWGIKAARMCRNRRAEARLLVQLGYANLNLERYDEARQRFAASLELGEACDDARVQATAREHLGLVARSTGDLPTAIDQFSRALEIAENLGERRSMVLHLRRLGETYADGGALEEASSYLRRSADIADEIGDSVLHARALARLGGLDLQQGHHHEAFHALERAVSLLDASGAVSYLAETLETLADVCAQSGDTASARGHLQRALEIYTRSDDPKARRAAARLGSLPSAEETGRSDPEEIQEHH